MALGRSLRLRLWVPFHLPVLSLYLTSIATFGSETDWPFFSMVLLNTDALTAPTLSLSALRDIGLQIKRVVDRNNKI